MRAASILVNGIIFLSTAVILALGFREDGRWKLRKGLGAFRYFTVLSNALCAVAALVMALCQAAGSVPPAVMVLKYLGTASVAVTLATVFLFLGPSQGGFGELLRGSSLYMHLIGPLLAIASFCLLEKGRMSLGTALLGVLPVLAYGAMYLYRVVYAPVSKRWEDFYGFNKGGRWPIAFGAMVAGTLLICAALWLA